MSENAQKGAWMRHAALLTAPLALLAVVMSGAAVPAVLAGAEKKQAIAPPPVRVFTGATILPVSGPPVTDGVLVVDGGKIVAVGPRATTAVPAGAEVVDCAGQDDHARPGVHAFAYWLAGGRRCLLADSAGGAGARRHRHPRHFVGQGAGRRIDHGQHHAGLWAPRFWPDGLPQAAAWADGRGPGHQELGRHTRPAA
jgi:hypothetical protein